MFDTLSEWPGEPWRRSDAELLAALANAETDLRRQYGHILELLGELRTRGVCEARGYPSLARMLQDQLRISRKEATRRLAHAEAVVAGSTVDGQQLTAPLPATAQAMRAGVLDAAQLDVVQRTLAGLPPAVSIEAREHAEQVLVEAAHTVDAVALGMLGRQIRARLDQDGAPPTETELLHPSNELRMTRFSDGHLKFTGRLDVEGAALLTTVLSPLAKPKPAADGTPDPRSTAERHGDALIEALRLAANCGDLPTECGERPTIVVTVPLDALRDQLTPALLDGPGLLDARAARRLACDSQIVPAVLGSRSEPLDVGRKTRSIPTSIRRALVLRDGGCAFPGCCAPARWCDGHHIRHWVDGGETTLHNLVLLCGFHHRLLHYSEWEVQLIDNVPVFFPPAFVDPHRRPRRNPVHRALAD